MFNICKKCFKCRKNKSKKLQINLETEKIISSVKKEYGLRVYLNIYHLTIFNYILQFFGIFINRFKYGIEKKWLKEKIYLGNTPYDINSVNEIFKLYIPFWLGRSYNLFQKNCNNFTKFFAGLLLRNDNVINYPDYVNRITIFAQYFSMFYNPIKKLYFYNNNTPSISSSLNSEFLNDEVKENNNNENNKENNCGGNSSNKELNSSNKESTEINVEISNNIKSNSENKEITKENKEENNPNFLNKNEEQKEKENNGG